MLAMFVVTVFCAGVIACGDDDNDGKKDGDVSGNVGIVGTWTGQYGRHQVTFVFKEGDKGMYVDVYDDSYSGKETETGDFTYTRENDSRGMIILQYYDSYSGYETDVLYYVLSGNTMSVYEDGYGEDLWVVLTKTSGSSNDDDASAINPQASPSVIGTWTGQDGRDFVTLTFKDGGKGTYVSIYYDSYSGEERMTGSFSYTPVDDSRGTIILKVYDSYSGTETELLYYVIKGSNMYIYEDGYGEDLELVLTKQ